MDPMDYTMDEGHGQPAQNLNAGTQCHYQPSHQSPNPSSFNSQSRDAHHYDPVHNTESWHPNRNHAPSRPSPPHAGTHSHSLWSTPTYDSSWQGFGESRRQGHDVPAFPGQPGFMNMLHAPWGEARRYEPPSFGYIPGMYAENGITAASNAASRGSMPPSTHSHDSPMRRYPTMGDLPEDYARRVTRAREDNLRNLNSNRMRDGRAAAGPSPNPPQIPGHHDYPHNHSLDASHPRRYDNHDSDSEDDDDPVRTPDGELYPNPYRASLFNNDTDDERRLAAARGALAAAKRVPSKEFVASLEKLNPKDIKDADRTCMICYNEFGIQNPDGIIEQPIRLPKCKHIFGDKCIKKWFEDSDSCPYCRDKLPSEPVHRKHSTIDHLYLAQSRRAQFAAAQAHSSRVRGAYPPRSSDEIYGNSSSQYLRHSQEEYHYMMRANGAPDPWSYSPPIRTRDSENRRRPARGRASLGRPTSVGSARHLAPGLSTAQGHVQNLQRPHLQSVTPHNLNSINSFPVSTPRRSITPGLSRQHSTGSVPTAVTPRNRLSGDSSSSSEEASPPVAVGSGVATTDRHSTPSGSRSYLDYTWADQYGSHPIGQMPFPTRAPHSGVDMEHSGQTMTSESRSTDAEHPQRQDDSRLFSNGHEVADGHGLRWSR